MNFTVLSFILFNHRIRNNCNIKSTPSLKTPASIVNPSPASSRFAYHAPIPSQMCVCESEKQTTFYYLPQLLKRFRNASFGQELSSIWPALPGSNLPQKPGERPLFFCPSINLDPTETTTHRQSRWKIFKFISLTCDSQKAPLHPPCSSLEPLISIVDLWYSSGNCCVVCFGFSRTGGTISGANVRVLTAIWPSDRLRDHFHSLRFLGAFGCRVQVSECERLLCSTPLHQVGFYEIRKAK